MTGAEEVYRHRVDNEADHKAWAITAKKRKRGKEALVRGVGKKVASQGTTKPKKVRHTLADFMEMEGTKVDMNIPIMYVPAVESVRTKGEAGMEN